MRIVRMSAPGVRSSRRAGKKKKEKARLPGLRWVPVPLALLVAALGVLVIGSIQGRAAADLASHPNEAGGLSLSVTTMLWMSNDMGGSGATQPPADDSADGTDVSSGYDMPSSMMPGLQPAGDNRLRVEVNLTNETSAVQQYALTDFTLTGPGGQKWQVDDQDHAVDPVSAYLQPGFSAIVDVYFDVQAADSKNLTLHWSRAGRTISLPVNTSTAPSSTGMNMNM